ncbi:MAG: AMP nucleosidase [Waddliaceae bacterium]|nr:AMP nucleosidase [Waddliaceae bacterium]
MSIAEYTHEEQIARDTLERYAGCPVTDFQPYLMLTNFPKYVDYFAESRSLKIHEGSMFKVAHLPEENVSILDFKIGSPAAALVIDLCSFLPLKAALLLGMTGGLRRHYEVGDYFMPVAAIRGEGTSDFYFPAEVPALANFLVQRAVTEVLDDERMPYHIGITHTTNKRFWEFNEEFKNRLKQSMAQAVEMECATLFAASYKYRLPLGALLLVSDLPLRPDGIKTKESSNRVYAEHTKEHVELGLLTVRRIEALLQHKARGARRSRPGGSTSFA